MNSERIKKQVDNLIITINQLLMEETDISCIMDFFCSDSKENMNLKLDMKKDDKFSITEFEVDIPKGYDYVFYEYFLSMILESYITHNSVFITDITKNVKGITARSFSDFEYKLEMGHIDGKRRIKIYMKPFSNLDKFEDIIVSYNEQVIGEIDKSKKR